MRLKLQFFRSTRQYPFPGFSRHVQHTLKFCMKKIPLSPGNVLLEVSCVGSDKMKNLNKVWRKKNRSTDILSFGSATRMRLPDDVAGCLVFCPETISKKWKEEICQWGLKAVYQRLVIHGFVHLLGFDHMKFIDEKKMIKVEKWLGVPEYWFK